MSSGFKAGILAWLALLLSLLVFALLLPGLVTAAYHPIAPGIHLIPVRIALSASAVVAFFILALWHSGSRRHLSILRKLGELGLVPCVLWVAFQITAALNQQSDPMHLTFDSETYAIPRVFAPDQSTEQSAFEHISITICNDTSAPVYADNCHAYGYVELGHRPITERFEASFTLDEAGVLYAGDNIADWLGAVQPQSDGSVILSAGGRDTRFLLDETGRIDRFASCYVATQNCTVSVRTARGILSFPAHGDDAGARDFWRVEEAHWRATFEGWICKPDSCVAP